MEDQRDVLRVLPSSSIHPARPIIPVLNEYCVAVGVLIFSPDMDKSLPLIL